MKLWGEEIKDETGLGKQIKKDKSIVMTKPEMVKELMKLVPLKEGDSVLEPCRGDGAFYNEFPSFVKKSYCEIDEGIDFLDFDESVDYIITNPPFVPRKLFIDFLFKSMKVCNKGIYFLVNMNCLQSLTPKRLSEMERLGWNVSSINLVQDKRWFGRYTFIGITHEPSILGWNEKVF